MQPIPTNVLQFAMNCVKNGFNDVYAHDCNAICTASGFNQNVAIFDDYVVKFSRWEGGKTEEMGTFDVQNYIAQRMIENNEAHFPFTLTLSPQVMIQERITIFSNLPWEQRDMYEPQVKQLVKKFQIRDDHWGNFGVRPSDGSIVFFDLDRCYPVPEMYHHATE